VTTPTASAPAASSHAAATSTSAEAPRARGGSSLRWAAPVLALVLLGAWELLGQLEWISVTFFPPPSVIVATLGRLIANGELPRHLGATVSRVLLALVWGGGLGLVLGMTMGYSARVRTVLDPFVAALHPVPKLSLLPLIMLIFGIGWFSKALVVAVSTFFPMVISTMAGVRQIDSDYYDVAKVYGASRWRVFRRVLVPASLPSILAGARMAMNRALGATIGLELITADTGLGAMLFFAWQTLRTEQIYATLCVIALLGYVFRATTDGLASKLVPWQRAPRTD
jgi:ABC-type nitrate/sulfonate/bicarbonate transport system permease component